MAAERTCTGCGGAGTIAGGMVGYVAIQQTCPSCHGLGRVEARFYGSDSTDDYEVLTELTLEDEDEMGATGTMQVVIVDKRED